MLVFAVYIVTDDHPRLKPADIRNAKGDKVIL
jgi:hypothetical protein